MRLSRRNADRPFRNKGLDEVENLLEEATVLAKKMGKIKGRKKTIADYTYKHTGCGRLEL